MDAQVRVAVNMFKDFTAEAVEEICLVFDAKNVSFLCIEFRALVLCTAVWLAKDLISLYSGQSSGNSCTQNLTDAAIIDVTQGEQRAKHCALWHIRICCNFSRCFTTLTQLSSFFY